MNASQRRHRRHRRLRRLHRGASLVEVVVAATLILAVLTVSSLAITSSERSLAASRTRDAAAAVAANVLARASIYDCQLVADPAEAQAAAQRCAADVYADGQTVPDASAAGGDYVFSFTSPSGCTAGTPGCIRFDAALVSTWQRIDDAANCPSATSAARPDVLRRTLRLTWTLAGAQQSADFSATVTPSRSVTFTDPDRSSVTVAAPAGAMVLLTSTAGTVVRFAGACTGGADTGEAWFPFLPADGTYTVRVLAGTTVGSAATFASALAAPDQSNLWASTVTLGQLNCSDPDLVVASATGVRCRSGAAR